MIPGPSWDSKARVWTLPLAVTTCFALQAVFKGGLEVGPALGAWYEEQRDTWLRPCTWLGHPGVMQLPASADLQESTFERAVETIERMKGIEECEAGEDFLWLKPYQEVSTAFLMLARQAIYASDVGCGKTPSTILALDGLNSFPMDKASETPYPALVIAPKGLLRNWARELERWLPGVPVSICTGTPAKRRKAILATHDDGGILVINYDAVRSFSRLAPYGSIKLARCLECLPDQAKPVRPSACEVHERELNSIDWATVICDEAHRLKDGSAKTTRAVKWVSRHARYRFALTGTPTANNVGDLWSLLNFVNPDEWPTSVGFKDRYCEMAQDLWGPPKVIGIKPGAEEELRSTLDARMIRHTKDQVLPFLPPKAYEVRTHALNDKERKAYTQMDKGLIAQLDDGQLVAWNALSEVGRLTQLAASNVRVDKVDCDKCHAGSFSTEECPKCHGTGELVEVTPIEPSSKLDLLDEVLEDTAPEPVVVFFTSRKLLELYAARLRKHHKDWAFGEVHGLIDEAARDEAVQAFQAGQLRCLLLTIGAGAEGLTLTRARIAIFVQRPWSFVQNTQAEGRTHRIGAEVHESLVYIDLVAEDTVEEHVREVLVEKGESFEEVVKDKDKLPWILGTTT